MLDRNIVKELLNKIKSLESEVRVQDQELLILRTMYKGTDKLEESSDDDEEDEEQNDVFNLFKIVIEINKPAVIETDKKEEYTGPKKVMFEMIDLKEPEPAEAETEEKKATKKPKKRKEYNVKLFFKTTSKKLKKWVMITSWTGPRIVLRRRYILYKIFWAILFLLFMAATIYVLVIQVLAFQAYPEVTSISITQGQLLFPTITICNLNLFQLVDLTSSNLNQFNNYENYTNSYDFNGTQVNLNNTLEQIRLQKLQASIRYNQFPSIFQAAQSNGYQNIAASFQKQTLRCTLMNDDCNFQTDFSVYPNTDSLFCFKYNWNINSLKTVNKAGLANGLQFSFYLGGQENDVFASKRGLRVFIHNSTELYPTASFTRFFDVAPGKAIDVKVKQTYYQRLSQPYTNCILDVTPGNTNQTDIMKYMFNTLNVPFYTFKLCESVLFTQKLRAACGCIDRSFLASEINQICHYPSQIDCHNQFRLVYSGDQLSNCPLECSTTTFDTSITHSEYISDWYVNYMKKSIQPYLNNLNESRINPQLRTLNAAFPQSSSTDSIRGNIVSFNIYFNSLLIDNINGVVQINWFNLLTNMCGVTGGGFVGMSLLSIVEFFEFLFVLSFYWVLFFTRKYELKEKFKITKVYEIFDQARRKFKQSFTNVKSKLIKK